MWSEGINHTAFFPVVMVKDPYHWMGSQCRHPYYAFWDHDQDHCPHLTKKGNKGAHVPVETRVRYALGNEMYESLLGVWNEFYKDWEGQAFPHLTMRFEDLLFHGEEVTKIACECVGGEFTKHKFKYMEESAKENGFAMNKGANGLVKSLIQYGKSDKRLEGLTDEDRIYASRSVNSDLMQKFGYEAPPLPT